MRQTSLPARMPVPQLNASMGKFLTAVRPLLDDTQFEETKKAASDFAKDGGVGQRLQDLLVERYKTTENWVSK